MLTAWQVVERLRAVAHCMEGKVSIKAISSERTIFEVGYDGETTWTQDGVMPKAEADRHWADNCCFGIFCSAQFAWTGKVANL